VITENLSLLEQLLIKDKKYRGMSIARYVEWR